MQKFNVYNGAVLVKKIEAENLQQAAKMERLDNPKFHLGTAWQWFVDGERSYAIEIEEQ